MLKDKEKALEAAIAQIEKSFGKGAIMRLGENTVVDGIKVISTGSLSLDIALGIGGVPRGRVTEIYGPESSGKTTLALSTIAQAQKAGGMAAFIDAEHALDINYAARLGVNISELLVSQPDSGEQALEVAETLVRSGAMDLIVIDSVAALVPKAEIEGDMGNSLPGLHARLMSQAMRKLTGAISKSHTAIIFINQIRLKIGISYGNPETTTGGNALKFYSSMRMDIRKVDSIKESKKTEKDSKDGQEVVGIKVKVKVVKNKLAPPFKQVEFDIIYNQGISRIGEIIDMALNAGLAERSGTWYSYNGTKLGQGRDNARKYIQENEALLNELEQKVLEKHGLGQQPQSVSETNKKENKNIKDSDDKTP